MEKGPSRGKKSETPALIRCFSKIKADRTEDCTVVVRAVPNYKYGPFSRPP